MAFAEWAQNNEASFNNVWFSDEAHFHLDGVIINKMCDFGMNPGTCCEKLAMARRFN
jgi:hypothetical protein